MSLQCSWIRRLFDDNFHDWKIIPLFLIKKKFGENFKFHSNVDITKCSQNNFSRFYKEILTRWSKYLSFPVSLPSTITSQFLWFNKYIKIDGKFVYFRDFSNKRLHFVGQLFDLEVKLKSGTAIKNEFHLLESERTKEQNTNLNGLSLYDRHLIKKNQAYSLGKPNRKKLYNILILGNYKKTNVTRVF